VFNNNLSIFLKIQFQYVFYDVITCYKDYKSQNFFVFLKVHISRFFFIRFFSSAPYMKNELIYIFLNIEREPCSVYNMLFECP